MSAILELKDVTAYYGATRALHGVSLSVQEGGITVLLGANGAGKTSTLRAIFGMIRTEGTILSGTTRIDGMSTEGVARLGFAHVPENRGTFAELTVFENLRLGAYMRRDRQAASDDIEAMLDRFPVLRQRSRQQAGTLSGGEQQMLAIARALMQRPRLLLLDEPSFGLAPLIVRSIFGALRQINAESGVSVLLIEQNANLALDLADDAYLLESGRIVLSGSSAQMRDNADIRKSYLGID